MKKHAFKIAGFLLGFCVVLSLVSVPFQPLKRLGTQYKDVLERVDNLSSEKKESIDALILGDSIAWAGISPLRMYAQDKISVYNCGTSGQRLRESVYILERALESQKPEAVVLDVNCVMAVSTPLRYYFERVEEIFPALRYHDYYLKESENKGSLDAWKGYTYTPSTYPMEPFEYMVPREADWPDKNRPILDKLYKLCKKKGVSLVLMALPCPKSWNQTKHELIKKWAEERNLDFLDMNVNFKVDIDWHTDFRDDGDHLNDMGATKCSYALSKYLKETYNLQEKTNQEYERAIEAVGVYGQDGLQ